MIDNIGRFHRPNLFSILVKNTQNLDFVTRQNLDFFSFLFLFLINQKCSSSRHFFILAQQNFKMYVIL